MIIKCVLQREENVMNTICRVLESNSYEFDYSSEDYNFRFKTTLPKKPFVVMTRIDFDVYLHLVTILVHLPLSIQEDKLLDCSSLISHLNATLKDGYFVLDVLTNKLYVKVTLSYYDNLITEEQFKQKLSLAFSLWTTYYEDLCTVYE